MQTKRYIDDVIFMDPRGNTLAFRNLPGYFWVEGIISKSDTQLGINYRGPAAKLNNQEIVIAGQVYKFRPKKIIENAVDICIVSILDPKYGINIQCYSLAKEYHQRSQPQLVAMGFVFGHYSECNGDFVTTSHIENFFEVDGAYYFSTKHTLYRVINAVC